MLRSFSQRTASKFGNKPTTVMVPGHHRMSFHSGKEAARAVELGAMEMAKVITGLRFQPQYNLEVNGVKVCKYIADFEYERDGQTVVEDVKGFRTETYLMKRRLMLGCLGIEVLET